MGKNNAVNLFKDVANKSKDVESIAQKLSQRNKNEKNALSKLSDGLKDRSSNTRSVEQFAENLLEENEKDIRGEEEALEEEEEAINEQKQGEDEIGREEEQLRAKLNQLEQDLDEFRLSLIKSASPNEDFEYSPDQILDTANTLAEEVEETGSELNSVTRKMTSASKSLGMLSKGLLDIGKDHMQEESITGSLEKGLNFLGERSQQEADAQAQNVAAQENKEVKQEERQEKTEEEEIKGETGQLDQLDSELEEEEEEEAREIKEIKSNILSLIDSILNRTMLTTQAQPQNVSLKALAQQNYRGKGQQIANARQNLVQARNDLEGTVQGAQRKLQEAMGRTQSVEETESNLEEITGRFQGQ